jgi:hypothetical protein
MFLGLTVVVLVLASCTVPAAQQPAAPAVTVPAVAPTTATPAAKVGAGTPPLGSYAKPAAQGGLSILTLAEGGQYTRKAGEASGVPIEGTWKVTDDQIQFKETNGGDCPGVVGTYTWVSDGETLKLALVQDTCSLRAGDLTLGLWVRQR